MNDNDIICVAMLFVTITVGIYFIWGLVIEGNNQDKADMLCEENGMVYDSDYKISRSGVFNAKCCSRTDTSDCKWING